MPGDCGKAKKLILRNKGWFNRANLVKKRRVPIFVIPVETGIQCFKLVMNSLDSRLRGNDDLSRIHQPL
jgi:hypothetical protein